MTSPSYAVFQQQDGALCALSIADLSDQSLKQVSPMFRSLGRAIVERQRLERAVSDGGANA